MSPEVRKLIAAIFTSATVLAFVYRLDWVFLILGLFTVFAMAAGLYYALDAILRKALRQ